MSWHYLPVYRDFPGRSERVYTICTIFLDDANLVRSWTIDPAMHPQGCGDLDDNPAGGHTELISDLEKMLRDARRWKPVAFDALKVGMKLEGRAD
jgi:hypothetical protein